MQIKSLNQQLVEQKLNVKKQETENSLLKENIIKIEREIATENTLKNENLN